MTTPETDAGARGPSTEDVGGLEGVVIRKAVPEDVESIQRMLSQIDGFHANLLPRVFHPVEGARPDDLVEGLIRDEGSDCLLAVLASRVVGYIDLRENTTPDSPLFIPRKFAFIENMVVDQEFRGRGIGRLLMDAAKGWARERGLERIQLTVWSANEEAIRFYDREGFRTVIEKMEAEVNPMPQALMDSSDETPRAARAGGR